MRKAVPHWVSFAILAFWHVILHRIQRKEPSPSSSAFPCYGQLRNKGIVYSFLWDTAICVLPGRTQERLGLFPIRHFPFLSNEQKSQIIISSLPHSYPLFWDITFCQCGYAAGPWKQETVHFPKAEHCEDWNCKVLYNTYDFNFFLWNIIKPY